MITKPRVKLGPQNQGQKMSLKVFEFAGVPEGHVYELARGVIVVSEGPDYWHAMQVEVIRDWLRDYKRAHPGRIHAVLGAMECKLLLTDFESERHPDLAVYLRPPPGRKSRTVWRTWIPDVVIEVVSRSSVDRDYVEKREEYWRLGVKEYWIVDALQQRVLLLKRGRTDWRQQELHEDDFCQTKLLPAFRLPCRAVFAAASMPEEE
jgi:Uma2 family endonuclease